MNREFEIITHNNANFHIFIVNLLYRTPHFHNDYEICYLLEGNLNLMLSNRTCYVETGDLFLLNPLQPHELLAETPARILSVQISPHFFASVCPELENREFDEVLLCQKKDPQLCMELSKLLLDLAFSYFEQKPFFALRCCSNIALLFEALLRHLPSHPILSAEKEQSKIRIDRMRMISEYMDQHYTEKLLLTDLAEQLNLDLYYLSHFIKENFGISFQTYLTRIRCEQARRLLLTTDRSLTDICMACGFSDYKYFSRGFKEIFGLSAGAYRKNFKQGPLSNQAKSLLSTQEFMSVKSSLALLDRLEGQLQSSLPDDSYPNRSQYQCFPPSE